MIEGLVWPEEIKQQSKKAIFLLIFMEKSYFATAS
jgi:hypothetical protein